MASEKSLAELKDLLNSLSAVPEQQWQRFQGLIHEQVFKKGDHFVAFGDAAADIAFVRRGLMRKYFLTEEGAEFIKGFAWEGQFAAPYVSLLLGQRSHMSIEALEETTLWVLKYSDLQALFREHPCWQEIGRKVAEVGFIEREKREFEFLTLSASDRYERFCQDYPFLLGRLAQYHIASYLGITPVALSRIVNQK
jgi:CRP-like cAMP-binding protein